MPAINKVLNANIYIDGTNDQLGRASEVKLPEITSKMVEHSGLGMIGTLSLPAGLEEMVMSVKWTGVYADLIKFAGNPFRAHRFQLRASVQTFDATGLQSQTPLVAQFSGTWKKAGQGTYKPKEATELEDECTLTYYKLTLGTEELIEIDVMNNLWKVGGEDILAEFNANQGQ